MRVTVNSFSLSLDSLVEMGGVTPRYLSQDRSWVDSGHKRQTYPLSSSICAVLYKQDADSVDESPFQVRNALWGKDKCGAVMGDMLVTSLYLQTVSGLRPPRFIFSVV
jgi:hypothetical protein